jgi:type II protein arginine methyltransferase
VLVFPNSTFIPNKHSQPVLSKVHQTFLSRFMRLRATPWILLYDVGPVPHSAALDPTPRESTMLSQKISADPTPHLSYFRVLQVKQPPKPPIEKFGAGYQDFLQMPLQPLADNLESVTYEVFEKDPIKYEWYERAICNALSDWEQQGKSTSSPSGAVVIAVAGSGRGPLVSRALHAAEIVGIEVKVWAVEKNPNAYVLLQRTNRDIWDNQVTVVKSDMRSWKGPLHDDGTIGKVDILVSELLGSFADNELSPECLDGVQHVLNTVDGISIPASYSAHLTPIATPRIFSEISNKSFPDQNAFELPYVVMLHAYDFLSYDASDLRLKNNGADTHSMVEPALAMKPPFIHEAWSFAHPQPKGILDQSATRRGGSAAGGGGGPTGGNGANAHNNRFCQLRFPCPDRGVCHGLAGYFETMLYSAINEDDEDVELSTNPLTMERKSKDMISWFPIFFALKVIYSVLLDTLITRNRLRYPFRIILSW